MQPSRRIVEYIQLYAEFAVFQLFIFNGEKHTKKKPNVLIEL